MSDEKQTVADQTDPGSTTSGEEGGAQDDLDSLLARWDNESSQEDSNESETGGQSSTDPNRRLDEVHATVQRLEKERVNERVMRLRRDTTEKMQEATSGQVGLTADDWWHYLNGRASEDPRIQRAWENQDKDPKGWERVAVALAKDVAKRARNTPDPEATADREAVESAVHSASSAPPASSGPSEADIRKMSDREFQEYLNSLK